MVTIHCNNTRCNTNTIEYNLNQLIREFFDIRRKNMEITSFVMGVLTIVAIIFMVAVVVGLLMISKLNKQVRELSTQLTQNTDSIIRDMQSEHADTWQQFEATGRDITMVEQTLQNQMHEDVKVSKRYIDSRIDKLIDTYFVVKEAEQNTKKLIKG